jgi:hypothetical protein
LCGYKVAIIYTSTSSASGVMGTKWQNKVSVSRTAVETNKTRGETTNARKVAKTGSGR